MVRRGAIASWVIALKIISETVHRCADAPYGFHGSAWRDRVMGHVAAHRGDRQNWILNKPKWSRWQRSGRASPKELFKAKCYLCYGLLNSGGRSPPDRLNSLSGKDFASFPGRRMAA